MVDVAESLAALHLPQQPADDWFLSSPRQQHLQHGCTSSSAVSLFQDSSTANQSASSQQGHQSEATSKAEKQAAWSAIVGDLFQAVIEHLPAHTAQHAMLVCRQWHDSVTNGLVCLRPRALRLDCINSRSATDYDRKAAASICMHHMMACCIHVVHESATMPIKLPQFQCLHMSILSIIERTYTGLLQVCSLTYTGLERHSKAAGWASARLESASAELHQPCWV